MRPYSFYILLANSNRNKIKANVQDQMVSLKLNMDIG